ncbi:TetR/AcrR family transcriptional regulator [Streptomyces sp. NPDC051907]|uniref:TetR/AcrR family transcriptional regulator n=1 Tax=Streptomyces sp. NPDC051907 TaxID=3155284 RepID=UPI0034287047
MTTPRSRAGTKGVPRARREEQILAAATEEFGRGGYEATSLAAIAARVGVTKTLLHQYFGGKQDLYLACLAPIGDRLLDAIRTAMEPGGAEASRGVEVSRGADASEGLDASRGVDAPHSPLLVLQSVFAALEGRREAWFVLYDGSLPPDSEAARRAAHYRAAIDQLAATGTADLLRTTGSTDPLDADALKYAWRGLVTALVRWWINHPDQSPDAMTQRCARLFAAATSALAPGSDT